MSPAQSSFYAQWRVNAGIVPLLREELDSPPEYLLQAVWQHQRLLRDELKTPDGTRVKVLHPGFRSVEGGPDFRGAVIQLGDDSPKAGDIEVDVRPSGWQSHGHDKNPAFQNVILHVTWMAEKARTRRPISSAPAGEEKSPEPPILCIHDSLDASLGELNLWLGSEASQDLPNQLHGKCCAPLRELTEPDLIRLLNDAARVRLESKAAQFRARAKQAGWDQALCEGLFRALGYKHNVWPMHRIAELRSRWSTRGSEPIAVQARLLGISGLLPTELSRSQASADGYVRRVWDHWWRERDEFADCVLPKSVWRFHGLRPANHPQRRLALASRWPLDGELASRSEKWGSSDFKESELADSLLDALQASDDEFWSWHCTFRSARLKRAQPLLGSGRGTDLAINVVLPWLWIRAVESKSASVQRKIEKRYFAWPAAEDNSVLRLARQRLLGSMPRRLLRTASAQQGLIQIVRDFCERSNALCDHCQFPTLVKDWRLMGA